MMGTENEKMERTQKSRKGRSRKNR